MFLHKTHLPKTQVEWNLKIPYYRKNQNPTKTQNKRIHKEQIQLPETTANPEPEKKQESKWIPQNQIK